VSLLVYDPLGRLVTDLTPQGWLPIGEHRAVWNAAGLPAGNYVLCLRAGDLRQYRQAVVVK